MSCATGHAGGPEATSQCPDSCGAGYKSIVTVDCSANHTGDQVGQSVNHARVVPPPGLDEAAILQQLNCHGKGTSVFFGRRPSVA